MKFTTEDVLKEYESELSVAKESLKMTEELRNPEWTVANRVMGEKIEKLEIVVEALRYYTLIDNTKK